MIFLNLSIFFIFFKLIKKNKILIRYLKCKLFLFILLLIIIHTLIIIISMSPTFLYFIYTILSVLNILLFELQSIQSLYHIFLYHLQIYFLFQFHANQITHNLKVIIFFLNIYSLKVLLINSFLSNYFDFLILLSGNLLFYNYLFIIPLFDLIIALFCLKIFLNII